MGIEMIQIAEMGLDVKSGLEYTGGEQKYISAIQRFYKNYEKNRKKVEELYEDKDYDNYMVTVHALKSNARMIGANDLSKGFEGLEGASREKDAYYLDRHTNQVLDAYGKLIKKMKPLSEMEEVHASDEISADEARDISKKLLEALDDFDDRLSSELAKKLSGYPFRVTQRDKLKEAVSLIEDFMYDDAADIIREISSAIE